MKPWQSNVCFFIRLSYPIILLHGENKNLVAKEDYGKAVLVINIHSSKRHFTLQTRQIAKF